MFIAALSAERLERFLESLRTGPKKLSVQTTNDYLQAASQFCNWLVENERLERNPFAKVQKGNPERDRRHIRRPLDSPELRTLVSGTRDGGVVRRKLTAEARAMLYSVGAYSGYRAGELAALTPECFLLDAGTATIDLSGEFTKNGKDASQPIPAELVATLRGFLKDRPAGQPVWPGKWVDRSADMIRNDAEAAGLTLDLDTKDGLQVLDFRSLRGTFATFLDEINMSLKARQDLMRHSDPRLTMNRYTRAKLHDLGAAVQNLPKLSAPNKPGREMGVLRATGTDSGCTAYVPPDVPAGGARRGQSGMIEVAGAGDRGEEGEGAEMKKPLCLQGFEDDQGPSKTTESGEGGIRTRGGVLPPRRFSKAVLSTTQPPLQNDPAGCFSLRILAPRNHHDNTHGGFSLPTRSVPGQTRP